jgi:hypothetical protein
LIKLKAEFAFCIAPIAQIVNTSATGICAILCVGNAPLFPNVGVHRGTLPWWFFIIGHHTISYLQISAIRSAGLPEEAIKALLYFKRRDTRAVIGDAWSGGKLGVGRPTLLLREGPSVPRLT